MDFRTCIDRHSGLIEIKGEVSPRIEITRKSREFGKKAILFENVRGKRICTNLFSERDFVGECLSTAPHGLLPLISRAIAGPSSPKIVQGAPFLENEISLVDLAELPIPYFFAGDGGPYLTASVFSAGGKDKGNISYHRVMITGANRGAVRLVERDLYGIYSSATREGGELPVAICIGVPLEVAIAGAISVDPSVDEYHIANTLAELSGNGPLELHELDNGCLVPTGSEYVMIGRLTPELEPEGPFVDITGTRDIVRSQPVLVVDRIYHRNDPILHAIVPGWYEHFLLMGMPREARIYEVLKRENIDVKNVSLTSGGCSWLHGSVSIKKTQEDHGVRAGELALRAHPSMKNVVVVDEDVDIFSAEEVEWARATRFQADRDMKIIPDQKGSSLDPSSIDCLTTKVIFDATMPLEDRDRYLKVTV